MGGATRAQNVTTFTRFAKNWSLLALAFYVDNFFFCLVCGLLEKNR
jgi:hypothetical protein